MSVAAGVNKWARLGVFVVVGALLLSLFTADDAEARKKGKKKKKKSNRVSMRGRGNRRNRNRIFLPGVGGVNLNAANNLDALNALGLLGGNGFGGFGNGFNPFLGNGAGGVINPAALGQGGGFGNGFNGNQGNPFNGLRVLAGSNGRVGQNGQGQFFELNQGAAQDGQFISNPEGIVRQEIASVQGQPIAFGKAGKLDTDTAKFVSEMRGQDLLSGSGNKAAGQGAGTQMVSAPAGSGAVVNLRQRGL